MFFVTILMMIYGDGFDYDVDNSDVYSKVMAKIDCDGD